MSIEAMDKKAPNLFPFIESKKTIMVPRFTLFVDVYNVPEEHGEYSTISTWSTRDESTGKSVPAQQFFITVRAAESMIYKYQDFYMVTCECGNKHLEEYCQECCDHDYDPDEGMMCLNCNAEYPW